MTEKEKKDVFPFRLRCGTLGMDLSKMFVELLGLFADLVARCLLANLQENVYLQNLPNPYNKVARNKSGCPCMCAFRAHMGMHVCYEDVFCICLCICAM